MRVIVTGSRGWTDRRTFGWALDVALALAMGKGEELTVVHGAAPNGADALAHQWVLRRLQAGAPVREETYPAEWKRPDGSTDKGAGFARNQQMVNDGADACLAFVERCPCPDATRNGPTGAHGTHGTVDCMNRAKAADIHVRAFQPRTDR